MEDFENTSKGYNSNDEPGEVPENEADSDTVSEESESDPETEEELVTPKRKTKRSLSPVMFNKLNVIYELPPAGKPFYFPNNDLIGLSLDSSTVSAPIPQARGLLGAVRPWSTVPKPRTYICHHVFTENVKQTRQADEAFSVFRVCSKCGFRKDR